MSKEFNLVIDKPAITDPAITHTGTTWEIRSSTFLDKNDNILFKEENDATNLYAKRVTLNDVTEKSLVYVRVKLHFSNNTESKWSNLVSVHGSQEGYKVSNTIVSTPVVSYVLSLKMAEASYLELRTSAFHMYLGKATHTSTTWIITDMDGKIKLYRPYDKEHLTSFTISTEELDMKKAYIVKAMFHTSVNVDSRFGKCVITEGNTFDPYGKSAYDIILLTKRPAINSLLRAMVITNSTGFKSADLKITNVQGDVILDEKNNQPTLFPTVRSDNLTAGNRYILWGRVNTQSGVSTAWKKLYDGIFKDAYIVDVDGTTYLDKFTQDNYLMYLKGYTVQATRQLENGSIYLTKHNDNKIYRYTYSNNKLVEQGVVYTLPDTDNITLPYLNVIPTYDTNKIVVNYAIESDGQYKQTKWLAFDVDNDGNLSLTGSKIDSYALYSTAVGRSAVALRDGWIYWVAYRNVDDARLAMYRTNPTTMVVEKVTDLKAEVYSNVSLAMHPDNMKILVIGGSGKIPSRVGNEYVPVRTNDTIHVYDARTKSWDSDIPLPTGLSNQFYSWHPMLRKDGKIVLFNSVDTGDKVEDQSVILIDPVAHTAVLQNIDYQDKNPYRVSVFLQNGECVRISSKEFDPQQVHRYVANTLKAGQESDTGDPEQPIEVLNVESGVDITIETPYKYKQIYVKSGGTLRWIEYDKASGIANKKIVVPGKAWVVCSDTEITQAEYDAGGWDLVHVVTDRTLHIKD